MKILTWLILCFCVLILAGWSVAVQTRKQVAPKPQFSKTPFDLKANQLPPKYLGHSLIDLWGLMHDRKKLMEKDEYETSEAWQTRVAKLNSKPLVGSLTPHSIFAFRLIGAETSYSADAQALTITASKVEPPVFDSLNEHSLSNLESFLYWYDNISQGSVIGSNAFGVKRRVKVEKETSYYLLFGSGRIGRANTLTLEEVKPEQAKSIRPLLQMLLICELIAPFTGGDKDETGATIDEPIKTTSLNVYTYVMPLAFWFYNSETGEVYYRADLQPKKQAEPKQ